MSPIIGPQRSQISDAPLLELLQRDETRIRNTSDTVVSTKTHPDLREREIRSQLVAGLFTAGWTLHENVNMSQRNWKTSVTDLTAAAPFSSSSAAVNDSRSSQLPLQITMRLFYGILEAHNLLADSSWTLSPLPYGQVIPSCCCFRCSNDHFIALPARNCCCSRRISQTPMRQRLQVMLAYA